jgi:HSP20 family protein
MWMLMRFDPFRDVERLLWGRAPFAPIDAYRDGERFVVRLDLPGVDPASIDLTIEKNVLTVHAERQAPQAEGQEWVVAERPHGTFSRQLFLGDGLNADHVDAAYDNGVLTVTVPVAEAAKARRVEITVGGAPKQLEAAAA